MIKSQRHTKEDLNYHEQQIPDGCHNCKNRYNGMFSYPGNMPVLGCSLLCFDPKNPGWCEEVDELGKCDRHEKGDPRKKSVSMNRLKMLVAAICHRSGRRASIIIRGEETRAVETEVGI